MALQLADEAAADDRRARRGRPSLAVSTELKAIIEALVFASPEPLTPKALFKLLDAEPREDVERALASLKADYRAERGLQMVEVAGGLQIVTRTDLHEWVRRLFHERKTHEALRAGPRDAGRRRLPAAGHRGRDHRDPRRQHLRRARHAASSASW